MFNSSRTSGTSGLLVYSYVGMLRRIMRIHLNSAFFLGGRRGTHTSKHFVNLTEESKNFKMLEFPLNQLQTYYGYLCDLLNFMWSMLATKMFSYT
jgi:hypothetical protein